MAKDKIKDQLKKYQLLVGKYQLLVDCLTVSGCIRDLVHIKKELKLMSEIDSLLTQLKEND